MQSKKKLVGLEQAERLRNKMFEQAHISPKK